MELLSAFLGIALAGFLAVAVASDPNDVSRCPSDLVRTRYLMASSWDVCYEFHMEERTWRTASGICIRRGGRLVTIRESHIQKFLIKSLTLLRWPRKGLWIGANDRKSEMDWRWITGEKVRDGYSNWASGQPSCGLFCFEDCALMRWREGGRWHDFRCNWIEDYSFICEFDMIPPPATTTTTTTTTTPSTTTTTKKSTTTTTTTTTSQNTTDYIVMEQMLGMKVESGYLSSEPERPRNKTRPPAILYGGNNLRHGQVKHIESDTASLTTGSLAGLVVGILIGLSCAVCFIFFILLRRRRRKQDREEDPQVRFENPYYAESPGLSPTASNAYSAPRETRHEDRNTDIGCASGGYEVDPAYACHKGNGGKFAHEDDDIPKMKAPPPPSPLHTRPKLVMNNYDTPPALARTMGAEGRSDGANVNRNSCDTLGGYKRMDKRCKKDRLAPEEEENYYSEVRSYPPKYTYDVPASSSRLGQDYANGNAAMAMDSDPEENIYYNDDENMYESLENFTMIQDAEENRLIDSSPEREPANRDDDADGYYANNVKENNYVPLKTEENEYY